MSNKNVNVWDLVKKKKAENEHEEQNINKKRKIILNSAQKLKNVQYKTSNANKRQSDFNFNKLQSINASKYLSPVTKTVIPANITERTILTSVEYNNGFINSLNPIIWIDSSNLTSLLRDSNNNIYQILDKSGNNNHLYQSVKANQPKYHNGGLLFNGNQLIKGDYTFTQSIHDMSIFIVMKQYNQTNESGGIISGYSINTPSDNFDPNAWTFNSSNFSSYQYEFSSDQGTNIPLQNIYDINTTMPYGIYEIIINNGIGNLYYNGTLISSRSFIGLGTFTNIVLGSRLTDTNTFDNFYTGEIYEVLLLDTPLDNGDRYKVEKYLMDKWATTQISRTIPLTNIYTWLDASSKNNFTLDQNNNVLAWNDKNFKLNFTQSNSSYYPVFDTNKVVFNNSFLSMTDETGLDLNNFSIFYVFDEITHNNNAGLLSCINTLGEIDDQITDGFALTTQGTNTIGLLINGLNLNYTDPTSLSKKLYEFNINNSVGTLYINGVLQGTTNFDSLGTGLQFVIGARQNVDNIDTSVILNANIYELIILNSSASYEQRNQIYSYLSEKWNINCILSTPTPNPTFWLDSNDSSSITLDSGNIIAEEEVTIKGLESAAVFAKLHTTSVNLWVNFLKTELL
jgi:hypothetical protein